MTRTSLAHRATSHVGLLAVAALAGLADSATLGIKKSMVDAMKTPRNNAHTKKATAYVDPVKIAASRKTLVEKQGGTDYGAGSGKIGMSSTKAAAKKGYGHDGVGAHVATATRDKSGLLHLAHHDVQIGTVNQPVRTEGRNRKLHWVN